MKKLSKLWVTFQTMNLQERQGCQDWLEAPFHNVPVACKVYYQVLLKEFQVDKPPEKQLLFLKVFPDRMYDDQMMRLLESQLLKHLEKYLIFLHQDDKSLDVLWWKSNLFQERKLIKNQQAVLHQIAATLERQNLRNADYHWHQYKLSYQKTLLTQHQQKDSGQELQSHFELLDDAYISAILRQTCYLLANQSVYDTHFDLGVLPFILDYLKTRTRPLVPAIEVYLAYYRLITDPQQQENFYQFYHHLENYHGLLPENEQRDLYLAANNFCIRQLNKGQKEFEQTALDIYKRILNKNLFKEGMSYLTFSNIVALALKIGDLDWAERFIRTHSADLLDEDREGSMALNLARLAYSRKNYSAALTLLQKADFRNLLNHLVAKSLLIKVYYEAGEFETLDYQLTAMKAFLYRHKVMGWHKQAFLNLLRYTTLLLKRPSMSKLLVQQTLTKIKTTENFWEKEWLIRQFEK